MVTKNIKGVIIPRHDTAINWAKATNFVPQDSELVVYKADDVTDVETVETITDAETGDASYSYTATALEAARNPTFECIPSTRVRFKFGDGKTNVNLLPFVTTGVGEASVDSATRAWVKDYINNYDSVALMEVSKTGLEILQLDDIYPIQNNAKITVSGTGAEPGVTLGFYSENLLTDECIGSPGYGASETTSRDDLYGVINITLYVDYSYYTTEEDGSDRIAETGISFIGMGSTSEQYFKVELPEDAIAFSSVYFLASGPFGVTSLEIPRELFKGGNTYIIPVEIIPTGNVENPQAGVYFPEQYLKVKYCLQATSTDTYTYSEVAINDDGTLDTSKLTYPTTIIGPSSTNFPSISSQRTITATYDTEYKVDQHYNAKSAIPQSGTAVAEALDSLVTIVQGTSIEDIPSSVTNKIVILYE